MARLGSHVREARDTRPKRVRGELVSASGDQLPSGWDVFYRVVRLIPKGRVTTYGAIAALAGRARAARQVGYAMAALKESGANGDVPWHRVLGAFSGRRARVSIKDPVGGGVQRALLEQEGVVFDERGRVSLERFGWMGPGGRRATPANTAGTQRPTADRSPRRSARG